MAKKKKYVPKKEDDWDVEEAKEHRKIIEEKSKAITELIAHFIIFDNLIIPLFLF